MSDAVFPRTRRATARPAASESLPLPRGYGLLAGAAVSAGLWGAIAWLLVRVIG